MESGSRDAGLLPVRLFIVERSITMPRKKLARRFDPIRGVNRPMLEVEAQYVAKEIEVYVRLSANELRKMIAERKAKRHTAEGRLVQWLGSLPEHARLALECLVIRDAYHLLELYILYVGTAFQDRQPASDKIGVRPVGQEPLVFSESLFDHEQARA
jgi:hypothetical protein